MPWDVQKDRNFRRVRLVDCSMHGLSIMSDQSMVPGDEFLAKLKLAALCMLVYRVRHCVPAGESRFKIGAEVVGTITPPSYAETDPSLKAILDQPRRSAGSAD